MVHPDYKDVHIETTMPKAWEHEESFNDVLYDWMSRAPWLAISAAAHLVLFLIISAIPWSLFSRKPDLALQASVEQAPEEVFEDPPEEEEEEIEEEETEEEPIIQDFEISDHNETDTDEDFESTEGDPDLFSNSPFDDKAFNNVIGIGGGAGGKFGGRFGGQAQPARRGRLGYRAGAEGRARVAQEATRIARRIRGDCDELHERTTPPNESCECDRRRRPSSTTTWA